MLYCSVCLFCCYQIAFKLCVLKDIGNGNQTLVQFNLNKYKSGSNCGRMQDVLVEQMLRAVALQHLDVLFEQDAAAQAFEFKQ